jgi:hypothetical protein
LGRFSHYHTSPHLCSGNCVVALESQHENFDQLLLAITVAIASFAILAACVRAACMAYVRRKLLPQHDLLLSRSHGNVLLGHRLHHNTHGQTIRTNKEVGKV